MVLILGVEVLQKNNRISRFQHQRNIKDFYNDSLILCSVILYLNVCARRTVCSCSLNFLSQRLILQLITEKKKSKQQKFNYINGLF